MIQGETITDDADNSVVFGSHSSSLLRLGLVYERLRSSTSGIGSINILGNLIFDLGTETSVELAGEELRSSMSDLYWEFGAGYTFWNKNGLSLYGELSARYDIENSSNYSYAANAGISTTW